MNIFGLGLPEIIVIMAVALLIFGPKKLPEIGQSLGKAIKGFQDASREFESEFKREAEQIQKSKPVDPTVSKPVEPVAPVASTPVSTVVESQNETSASDA